jgi:membrane-associated phospholipid phosphatase
MTTGIEKATHHYFLEHDLLLNTHFDRALRWLPYVAVFVAHAAGVKTRSGWGRQVFTGTAIAAVRYFLVDTLKNVTSERRPAPYADRRSFPSGHTASSFASAQFMHQELKDALPFFGCTGYLCGATVALLRVMKNRHWLKDVVAGAALGYLSAKLVSMAIEKIYLSIERRERRENSTKEKS